MTTTYPAPAPAFVPARHQGGPQDPRGGLIVIHSAVVKCRPGAARAVAAYFQRVERPASAHYSVDPAEVIQSVGDHTIAFHCGYNAGSIAVELCEMPSWHLARWNPLRFRTSARRKMWRRAVRLTAELCLAYDIPPRFVGPKRLRVWDAGGPGGVTTHRAMSTAFRRSTHWDPGAWPRRRFLRAVRRQVARIEAEAA